MFLPKLMQLRCILSKVVSLLHKAKSGLLLHVSHQSCEKRCTFSFASCRYLRVALVSVGTKNELLKIKKLFKKLFELQVAIKNDPMVNSMKLTHYKDIVDKICLY